MIPNEIPISDYKDIMDNAHTIIRIASRLPALLTRFAAAGARILCFLVVVLQPPTSYAAETEIPRGAMDSMINGIRAYGFTDSKILEVVRNVPRHKFVPEKYKKFSYRDSPLGIGYGQTISQPFIVAEMTRLLNLSSESKVLEIGTGSGYQAAVLAEITSKVYSIEIIQPLVEFAADNLKSAGYVNVRQQHGDGYYGWPEAAPFDGIIVTCAAGNVPPPLLEQLAPGGRMIIPVGQRFGTQHLILITKNMDGSISSQSIMPVRFVPLVRK